MNLLGRETDFFGDGHEVGTPLRRRKAEPAMFVVLWAVHVCLMLDVSVRFSLLAVLFSVSCFSALLVLRCLCWMVNVPLFPAIVDLDRLMAIRYFVAVTCDSVLSLIGAFCGLFTNGAGSP